MGSLYLLKSERKHLMMFAGINFFRIITFSLSLPDTGTVRSIQVTDLEVHFLM
jgi:hypothetical protein